MHENFDIIRIIFSITSVIWIILYIVLAGISFFRFRATLSGLLLGITFSVIAVKIILVRILTSFIFPALDIVGEGMAVLHLVSYVISILLGIVIAAGIALIPRSLQKLAKQA
jgi:hypothetical protein